MVDTGTYDVGKVAVVGDTPLDLQAVAGFVYLGLIATVVANALWFSGLRQLPAAAVSLVGLLNPVAGTVVGILLAGEAFGPTQALGMMLVLAGILAGQPAIAGRLRLRRAQPRHESQLQPQPIVILTSLDSNPPSVSTTRNRLTPG